MIGYDSRFFDSGNDSQLIALALAEDRVILTRDTQIMKRRVVTSGRLKAFLIESDEPRQQMQQIIARLKLDSQFKPFSLCLECNQPLAEKNREQVASRVPPYVFQTQSQYRECPSCRRIYWRGSHWQAMTRKLREFTKCSSD